MNIPREVAIEKLNIYIEKGREKSQSVIHALLAESKARISDIVDRQALEFHVGTDSVTLSAGSPRLSPLGELGFTSWSLDQAVNKTLGLPMKVIEKYQADGEVGTRVATQLLNDTRYRIGNERENGKSQRRLLRVVNNEVRGFLSPSYKILDQLQLVEGLTMAIQKSDSLFTEGTLSDRRYALTAIWPQIIEPVTGHWVVPGITMRSSDYGGAFELRQFLVELVCANGATGQTVIRRVHKGGDYGDDKFFEVSERTNELTAAALVSEMDDAVRTTFTPKYLESMTDSYRRAAVKEINPIDEADKLHDSGILSNEEGATALGLMKIHNVEIAPETDNENSALRWGSILSFMAGQSTGEKQITLQQTAGKYYLPHDKGE